ncbi:hypothetical protein A3D83_02695 [Candidatus Daviesbacteria bacterium RIFCSPHIGHO2_02_FULL_41_10]|uniref:Clp R domain-containing protein n=1 Tax=Candidatus Daviesbacteria bacterium RIFCSPHIGHO2_02_FULL_41_10 TaxID=1797774 RepID=A0A1F5JUS0_9BACT|nr:MAG: hypothetical protein A3D83_02695 [Candidatus Daviesbacteria bacterium RIFCSPHIGHO2_02_FULL_41_10]
MFTKEGLANNFGFPFSDGAVSVFNSAEAETRRFGHNYLGTEHILLGLVREEVPTLKALGVELSKVRSAVEFIIGRGDRMAEGEMQFTPRAKKVISLSISEAKRVRHRALSRNHILIGLVWEGEGIGAGILESLGASLGKVREQAMIAPLEETTVQALNDMKELRFFLLDPDQDNTRKKQLGMILKGARGLIIPQS